MHGEQVFSQHGYAPLRVQDDLNPEPKDHVIDIAWVT